MASAESKQKIKPRLVEFLKFFLHELSFPYSRWEMIFWSPEHSNLVGEKIQFFVCAVVLPYINKDSGKLLRKHQQKLRTFHNFALFSSRFFVVSSHINSMLRERAATQKSLRSDTQWWRKNYANDRAGYEISRRRRCQQQRFLMRKTIEINWDSICQCRTLGWHTIHKRDEISSRRDVAQRLVFLAHKRASQQWNDYLLVQQTSLLCDYLSSRHTGQLWHDIKLFRIHFP